MFEISIFNIITCHNVHDVEQPQYNNTKSLIILFNTKDCHSLIGLLLHMDKYMCTERSHGMSSPNKLLPSQFFFTISPV